MSQNIYNIIQGIVVAVLITMFLRRKWQFIGIEQESFHTEIELEKSLANTHSDSIRAISCLEAFAFILYNISVASAFSDKYLKRRKGRCQANLGRCSRTKLTTYCVDCYNRDLCSGNYTETELMIHEHARFISFQSCPKYLEFSALKLSKLGFYYAGKETIKCFCCGLSFTSMHSLSDIHKRRSPHCKFARGVDFSNIPIQHDYATDPFLNRLIGQPPIDSNTEPMYNRFSSLPTRLDSFENWPLPFPRPGQLPAAGFFFTNNVHLFQCYHCGIGFKHWNESDDPWIEHARHSPTCQHVRRARGDHFVRLVQQADTDAVQHVHTDVSPLAGMKSAAARACIEAGYEKEKVEEAVNSLQTAHGINPTLNVLVECLRRNNRADAPVAVRITPEARTLVRYKFIHYELAEITLLRTNNNRTDDPHAQTNRPGTSDVVEVSRQVLQDLDRRNELLTKGIYKLESQHAEKERQLAEKDRQLAEKERQLAEKERQLAQAEQERQQSLCKICLNQPSNFVLLPCGHMCCHICAPVLHRCGVCRTPVKGRVKTYMP